MQITFILGQVRKNADDVGGRKCDKLIIDYIILNVSVKTGLIIHDLAILDRFTYSFNACKLFLIVMPIIFALRNPVKICKE